MARFDRDAADRWRGRSQTSPQPSQWLRSASKLGLKRDPAAADFAVRGRVRGFPARVERQRRTTVLGRTLPEGPLAWSWTIELGEIDMGGRLTLVPESAASGLGKLFGRSDVQTGDEEFDAAVQVHGEAEFALAALSRPVRDAVRQALDKGIRFEGETLAWEFPDRSMPRRVLSRVRQIATLLHRLDLTAEEIERGLLRNAVRDPIAGVRSWNLGLLEDRMEGEPGEALLQAARAAVRHEDRRLRATGARILETAVTARPEFVQELAEAELVCLLIHGESDFRPALIDRLESVGGELALEPLAELTHGLFLSRKIKDAARRASAAIIGRGGGEARGGLSLSRSDEGDLSLIPRADGALGLA